MAMEMICSNAQATDAATCQKTCCARLAAPAWIMEMEHLENGQAALMTPAPAAGLSAQIAVQKKYLKMN